jgi:hypothetical protein
MHFIMGYDMDDLKVIKGIRTAPVLGDFMVNIPAKLGTVLSVWAFHYFPPPAITGLFRLSIGLFPKFHGFVVI